MNWNKFQQIIKQIHKIKGWCGRYTHERDVEGLFPYFEFESPELYCLMFEKRFRGVFSLI
jgi:hypothetical protein